MWNPISKNGDRRGCLYICRRRLCKFVGIVVNYSSTEGHDVEVFSGVSSKTNSSVLMELYESRECRTREAFAIEMKMPSGRLLAARLSHVLWYG